METNNPHSSSDDVKDWAIAQDSSEEEGCQEGRAYFVRHFNLRGPRALPVPISLRTSLQGGLYSGRVHYVRGQTKCPSEPNATYNTNTPSGHRGWGDSGK